MSAADALAELRQKVIAEPRAVLTASDRVNLKTFALYEPALKVAGGWMLGGRRYTLKALDRFEILALAVKLYERGQVKLRLTDEGRAVAAALAGKKSPNSAEPVPSNNSRAPSRYWLD